MTEPATDRARDAATGLLVLALASRRMVTLGYSMLLRTPAARVLASGLLFGWAHIVVHDGAAIALATVGG